MEMTLKTGETVLLDELDFAVLKDLPWRGQKTPAGVYAVLAKTCNGKKRTVYMSRVIAKTPDNLCCDHANGNTLDNRRENLRNCTHSENMKNRKLNKDNKTGIRGVSIDASTGRYAAEVKYDGKRVFKRFNTAQEAGDWVAKQRDALHRGFSR